MFVYVVNTSGAKGATSLCTHSHAALKPCVYTVGIQESAYKGRTEWER